MKKNTEENQQKNSLLGQLRTLEVGEELTLPAARSSYLKSLCTGFGLEWDKTFCTRTNREARTITAIRTR